LVGIVNKQQAISFANSGITLGVGPSKIAQLKVAQELRYWVESGHQQMIMGASAGVIKQVALCVID
jgi:hypothetical protein